MEKRYFTTKELSDYLGIGIGTLHVYTHFRKIPHLKLGRGLRFDIKEIEAWLAKKKIKEIS